MARNSIESYTLRDNRGTKVAIDSSEIASEADRKHRYKNQNLAKQHIDIEDRKLFLYSFLP